MLVAAGAKGDGGAIGQLKDALGRGRQNGADAGGGEGGKFLFPSGFETGAIFWGEGEEEFKVFAIGEGVVKGVGGFACGAAERDGGGMEVGAALGGVEQAGKVGGQAIGKIHHGGGKMMGGEKAAGFEAGFKEQMVAIAGEIGSAEGSGDIDEVAGFCAGPKHSGVAGNASYAGDMKFECVALGGIAAENAEIPLACGGDHAVVEAPDAREGGGGGSDEIDENPEGRSAHGGDVGNGAGNGFASDEAGGCGG